MNSAASTPWIRRYRWRTAALLLVGWIAAMILASVGNTYHPPANPGTSSRLVPILMSLGFLASMGLGHLAGREHARESYVPTFLLRVHQYLPHFWRTFAFLWAGLLAAATVYTAVHTPEITSQAHLATRVPIEVTPYMALRTFSSALTPILVAFFSGIEHGVSRDSALSVSVHPRDE